MSAVGKAALHLIQWGPKILRATDEDIARFGPQAARVRALLDFVSGMSPESATMARKALNSATGAQFDAARSISYNAAWDASRGAADDAARGAANDAARGRFGLGGADDAARIAARGEAVNDLIEPQVYKILTDPLNAGRVLDLRAPEAGSDFMRLIRELSPKSGDDIERIADLSVDPRVQGILELLGGLRGGMPLAAKIDAARRLDRASRAGRRMQ